MTFSPSMHIPWPAMPARHGCPVHLVLARLLRCQVTGLFYAIQIQAAGRKLRDLAAAPGGEFHLEDLGAHHAPDRALVHGEGVVAHPVPALEVVRIVNANHDLPLHLSPPARGAVRRTQFDSGIKYRNLQLAVAAK